MNSSAPVYVSKRVLRLGLWTLVVVLLLTGCLGTESGNPPTAHPPGFVLTYRDGDLTVVGAPGATHPPGASLVLSNVDLDTPDTTTTGRDDGSFEISIPAQPGDEVRLVLFAGTERSRVLIVATADDSPDPTDCVLLDPFEADIDTEVGSTTFVVANQCPASVDVRVVGVRDLGSGLRVTPSNQTVAPGESATFMLDLQNGSVPPRSHLLVFLEADVEDAVTRRVLSVLPQ